MWFDKETEDKLVFQDLLECELSATNGGLPENTSAKVSHMTYIHMFPIVNNGWTVLNTEEKMQCL